MPLSLGAASIAAYFFRAAGGMGVCYDSAMGDLNWDASFALARRLMHEYPNVQLEDVSLGMIYEWVVRLPEFSDDPTLANDEILSAIYQEWYEELNPL